MESRLLVPQRSWSRLPELGLAGAVGWETFVASWDDLVPDAYAVLPAHHRARRYARLQLDTRDERLRRLPHAAHYQERAHNGVYGGRPRLFAPIEGATLAHPVFGQLARPWGRWLRAADGCDGTYEVELHQMRCVAGEAEVQPTPEGLHRDGRDWVLVLLIARENVSGGRSLVTDGAGAPLAELTLSEPGSGLWLDDRRCMHAATPIRREDPARPGRRDTLVATFRRR